MNYTYTQLARVLPRSYRRRLWSARASRLWKRYLRVAAALAGPALAEPVTIAIVPSVPAASTLIAQEKGYFRDAGLEVTIERIDSMGKAVAFLAANHVQVAQGGVNAGIFNAIAQGLPVTLALDGGSTPLYHRILVRRGLAEAIKTPADLKGRTVGLSAPGSTSMYELAHTLASAGLCILPCFMAAREARLRRILQNDVKLIRSFWLIVHADMRDLARVRFCSEFIAEEVRAQRKLFLP